MPCSESKIFNADANSEKNINTPPSRVLMCVMWRARFAMRRSGKLFGLVSQSSS